MTIISQGSGAWLHPYGQSAPWGHGLSHGQYFKPPNTSGWIHMLLNS